MQPSKDNSAEAVAYQLMRDIALVEGKVFDASSPKNGASADRKWILDTFAECLKTAWAPDGRLRSD